MTANKSLLSAVGMAVVLAFSAPVLTVGAANAAGYGTDTATPSSTMKSSTTAPTMKKHKHHKKHQKHHKKPTAAAPAKPASAM